MSIFFIVIIASNARLAAAGSAPITASVRTRGVICHDRPQRSLHQPHSLSCPPLLMIAFHKLLPFGLLGAEGIASSCWRAAAAIRLA